MSNQCEHGQLARVCYTCELEARVAELDRLNTDLAMESHVLQTKVAELEALVPRWISVDDPPQSPNEYLCVVYNPWDTLKWRETRAFEPTTGWAIDDGERIVCWTHMPPTPPEDQQ